MFRGNTHIFGVTHLVGNKKWSTLYKTFSGVLQCKSVHEVFLLALQISMTMLLSVDAIIFLEGEVSFFFMPLSNVMTISTHHVHVDGTCML